MPTVQEKQVSFDSGGVLLRGMLHLPAEAEGSPFVFCPPFAEEKKCSYRVMVRAAWRLGELGRPVLRFDLSGTSDSEGDPADSSLSRWRQDIEAAIGFGKEEASAQKVSLLGLRLGASLAVQVASGRDDVQELVLWEPVVNGPTYARQNLQRSLIKRALTAGEGAQSAVDAQREGGDAHIDFDGHLVSAQCQEEMKGMDLLAVPAAQAERVLIVNITPRPNLTKACQELCDHYREAGRRVEAVPVREQPFWNLIGLVTGEATIEATVGWLTQAGTEGQPSPALRAPSPTGRGM